MKKDEAERQVRHYCGVWAKEKGFNQTGDENPSFYEFYSWLRDQAPECLDFRTRNLGQNGVRSVVEDWWASEMKQGWRY